jgi:hypothetical protein
MKLTRITEQQYNILGYKKELNVTLLGNRNLPIAKKGRNCAIRFGEKEEFYCWEFKEAEKDTVIGAYNKTSHITDITLEEWLSVVKKTIALSKLKEV